MEFGCVCYLFFYVILMFAGLFLLITLIDISIEENEFENRWIRLQF